MSALWTAEAVAEATAARVAGDWVASGVSIDTPHARPGDLFVALKGPTATVTPSLPMRCSGAPRPRSSSRVPDGVADRASLRRGRDTQAALEGLGRAGRAPAPRADRRDHRQRRQDRHQGGAAPRARPRQAPTHASAASHNNQWGVPLSLARLPEAASYGVFEMGMNHAGEIRP